MDCLIFIEGMCIKGHCSYFCLDVAVTCSCVSSQSPSLTKGVQVSLPLGLLGQKCIPHQSCRNFTSRSSCVLNIVTPGSGIDVFLCDRSTSVPFLHDWKQWRLLCKVCFRLQSARACASFIELVT